jgi:molybdopterin-guanine dinucleotide biosynthesis protein A
MGQDKAALPWGNVSLLDHMTYLLLTVTREVRVIGRGAFPDVIPGKGPLGGILTALQITDQVNNLVLAIDLPLLTPAFLAQFHSRFLASSRPIVACRVGSRFPLCLGIRRALSAGLARRVESGDLSVHAFIEASDAEILEKDELPELGGDPSMFTNVNTPEDWIKLRR